MDEKTTINKLKELVADFCNKRNWSQFHNPKDLAIGISTEANELLEIFRFKSLKEIKIMFQDSSKRIKIEEELADTFFFILRFAQMFDIDLDNILKDKINKNSIKYPLDIAFGSNKKYNE